MNQQYTIIFSVSYDHSTSNVIDWITYLDPNLSILRINIDQLYKNKNSLSICISNENQYLVIDNTNILIEQIRSIWLRKGFALIKTSTDYIDYYDKNTEALHNFIQNEYRCFINGLIELCSSEGARILGAINPFSISKTFQLLQAKLAGFKIPKTIISTDTEQIKKYANCNINNNIISKVLSTSLSLTFSMSSKSTHTSLVDLSTLDSLEKHIDPSLVQEYINKDYEVRAVFINSNIFCTRTHVLEPISNSVVDSRIITTLAKHQKEPFLLPIDVNKNITSLMKRLKLDYATVDLLCRSNEFYFLEVNPFGQYGSTSSVGNFQIDKHIANYLTHTR